jgi:hypothetical protein
LYSKSDEVPDPEKLKVRLVFWFPCDEG